MNRNIWQLVLSLAGLTIAGCWLDNPDKTAEKACSQASCPPGTTLDLKAASAGCDASGTVVVETPEGSIEARCFSSGSCQYVCTPPHKCCSRESWTASSYTCETTCCPDGTPPPCKTACGNGECDPGETPESCFDDCGINCGDGECTGTENPSLCPQDCATTCGDAKCEGKENPKDCPEDCDTTCGDGYCTGSENPATCSQDCDTTCGDGYCTGSESPATCSQDCDTTCGDGYCTGSENPATCSQDCDTTCGDDTCEGKESPGNCPEDCAEGACGDGTCDKGEDPQSCAVDCAPKKTTIAGKVFDLRSGAGIGEAHVQTIPQTGSVYTNDGMYSIELPGDYSGLVRVSATRSGYLSNFADIYVFAATENMASIGLPPGSADHQCSPACAPGWNCQDGKCSSLCSSLCGDGQICNGEVCVPVDLSVLTEPGCGDGNCSKNEFEQDPSACLPDCRPVYLLHETATFGTYVDYDGDQDIDAVSIHCEALDKTDEWGNRLRLSLTLVENIGSAQLGPAFAAAKVVAPLRQASGATVPCWSVTFTNDSLGRHLIADIDGDGALEIMAYVKVDLEDDDKWPLTTYHFDGTDFVEGEALGAGLPPSEPFARDSNGGIYWSVATFGMSDIDGDGKPDIWRRSIRNDGGWCDDCDRIDTYLNIGTRAHPVWSPTASNLPFFYGQGETFADVNGDGRADFLKLSLDDGYVVIVHLNTGGMTWSNSQYYPLVGGSDTRGELSLVDYDGTGYPNVIINHEWWSDFLP